MYILVFVRMFRYRYFSFIYTTMHHDWRWRQYWQIGAESLYECTEGTFTLGSTINFIHISITWCTSSVFHGVYHAYFTWHSFIYNFIYRARRRIPDACFRISSSVLMSYFNKRYSFLFVKSKNLQLYSYTTCTIVKMYTTLPMAMVHAYIPPRTILTNRCDISLRE
jgi:hypothetical protein